MQSTICVNSVEQNCCSQICLLFLVFLSLLPMSLGAPVESVEQDSDTNKSISCFCFSIPCSYPQALALVASGAVNIKPLITHHFKLEQTLEAFETSRTGAGGAIKVMIHCDEGYQI